MPTRRARLAAAAALIALPLATRAQPSAVIVQLVDAASGRPLPYGTIAAPTLARERFTDERGIARLADVPAGTLRIVARHLGFLARDTTLDVRAGVRDTVRVPLTRVATALAAMRVKSSRDCTDPGPPDSLADPAFHAVFAQFRENVDRMLLLASEYPYRYTSERRRASVATEHNARVEIVDTISQRSATGDGYRPGAVIRREASAERPGDGATLVIPTPVDLAGDAFLGAHCFAFAGVRESAGTREARIDFRPAKSLRGPDVEGTIHLDASTYRIRRLELRVTRIGDALPGVTSSSATTTFREVFPGIDAVDRIESMTTYVTAAHAVDQTASTESQRLLELHFDDAIPGRAPIEEPARRDSLAVGWTDAHPM